MSLNPHLPPSVLHPCFSTLCLAAMVSQSTAADRPERLMFEQWLTLSQEEAKVKQRPIHFLRAKDGVIDVLLIHCSCLGAGNGVVFNHVSGGGFGQGWWGSRGIRGDGICQELRQASLIHNCWVSQGETNYFIEQATSPENYPYNMILNISLLAGM